MRFIYIKDNEAEYIGEGEDIPEECLCDGASEFLKTYFQYKEKSFSGIVAGIKNIVINGYLIAESNYHYNGDEYITIQKEPKTVKTVAIVYYANNKKRYVDIEGLEVIE